MKVSDFLMALADVYADAKLFESSRDEVFLNSMVLKLENLISVADFENTLNAFKRITYRQMVEAKESGQREENQRLYSVYQKLKYAQDSNEILEIINGR